MAPITIEEVYGRQNEGDPVSGMTETDSLFVMYKLWINNIIKMYVLPSALEVPCNH